MMFNQLFVIYKQTCCQHTHTRLNIQTLLALFYVIKYEQRGREGREQPKTSQANEALLLAKASTMGQTKLVRQTR